MRARSGHAAAMATLVLLRHGQTEWSRDGRHTGQTNVPLTDVGRDQARALHPAMSRFHFGLVLVSPRSRAVETASLAGIGDPTVDEDLVEWDYGEYEGITTPQIRESLGRPWNMWQEGAPGGERASDVGRRIDRVLARVEPVLASGRDVCLVAHGHSLRVVTARWLGLDPAAGAHFVLDTGTVSELGLEHERHAVLGWNIPACGYT